MSRIDKLLNRALEEVATSELLLQNGRHRASISRSYYAVFYASQAWPQSKGLQTKTHKGTIQLSSLHCVRTGEIDPELRQVLQDAYTLRQLSDYDEASDLSIEQATSLLDAARSFVAQAEQALR